MRSTRANSRYSSLRTGVLREAKLFLKVVHASQSRVLEEPGNDILTFAIIVNVRLVLVLKIIRSLVLIEKVSKFMNTVAAEDTEDRTLFLVEFYDLKLVSANADSKLIFTEWCFAAKFGKILPRKELIDTRQAKVSELVTIV